MKDRKFTPFPVLRTARLTLRSLLTSDEESIFTLRSDHAVNRYLDRALCGTREQAGKFITQVTENIKRNESLYWAVTCSENDAFAGTICLFGFSNEDHRCELGYELLPGFQGKGIMREAVNAVINYAVHALEVQAIEAFTHKGNRASIKLLVQSGFVKVPEAEPVDAEYYRFAPSHKGE